MSNLEIIKDILSKSSLKEKEKKEFIELLYLARDEDLKILIELFSEDISWVEKIFNNFKLKKKALEKGDRMLWKKILKDEMNYLTEILNQEKPY